MLNMAVMVNKPSSAINFCTATVAAVYLLLKEDDVPGFTCSLVNLPSRRWTVTQIQRQNSEHTLQV